MAQITKSWSSGSGSVTVTYTGSRNGTISVASDPNEIRQSRSMSVSVKTSGITRTVTVSQEASPLNFKTADGYYFVTADNKYLNVDE